MAPGSPGWTRRRAGRGFALLDETGRRITDPEARERVRALAIPPAWRDVWICPWPHGHLGTVRREHVDVRGDRVTFVYAAKSGQVREVEVVDDAVARAVRSLLRRRDDHPDLLAYRDGAGAGGTAGVPPGARGALGEPGRTRAAAERAVLAALA